MQPKQTTVRLITHTEFPIESIYAQWEASRSAGPIKTAREYHERAGNDPIFHERMMETFLKVIASQLPITETISLTFLLENVSISLREQIVRHRVGHRFGEQLGCDTLPDDVATSSFWSQSMRVLNMGTFADDLAFLIPESLLALGKPELIEHYGHAMQHAQDYYNELVTGGIPPEDARNVLPLATQHRLSWTTNLQAISHVLSRRGCWIAQLGLWKPVVYGMVDELCRVIHPCFRRLVQPPCFSRDDEWVGCAFKKDNQLRVRGDDPEPPCSLYLTREFEDAKQGQFFQDKPTGWRLSLEVAERGLTKRQQLAIPAFTQKLPVGAPPEPLKMVSWDIPSREVGEQFALRAQEQGTLWQKDPFQGY